MASSSSSAATDTGSSPPICTELHAYYCMDVLAAHFEGREPISPPFKNAQASYALFVTWNTSSSSRPNAKPSLRGCIGNFAPMPLAKGLKDYALISALQDHRFSPIIEPELSSLSCNVSLLTPMTPILSPLSWTIGKHGIHLTFPSPSNPSRTLSATYLPEIAEEQGWTKEETVLSAIKKAGYRGRVEPRDEDEVWRSLEVQVYESEKSGAGWGEYWDWKKGRGTD
ncbi:AMMECR1 domain-containing protein [Dioszegia hungarica]|uniref:AMMECR1 domain-containing protein n=1 Tax=Dioszegia hungarica TaxID=4972 RepID=A0AA38HFK8_9TREE|nr:AMMECR1 domain-containing protein [Dioszegia hungarica]KAI9638689.1 AMMECR1 domain-containing protein [Dioszegia hungarica]